MKNIDLAKKIKELRTRKGLSQDELAESAQINLRTVQRIESGETEPRGDTLKRLANALSVTADELVDWVEQEDTSFITVLNLSALSFMIFPLLGIIVPMMLWILKKDKIKHVNEVGKKILNFQITWSVITFFGIYGFMIFKIMHLELNLLFVLFLYAFNLVMIVINTIRSLKNKRVLYQPALPLLR